MKIPKIIEWIDYDYLLNIQKEHYERYPNAGFYLEYDNSYDKYIKEIDFNDFVEDVLIKELVDNGYIISGDTHQYYAIPVFEDGYLMLSMRKWGEIMTKVYELTRGQTSYIPNFYLKSLNDIEEVLPYVHKR